MDPALVRVLALIGRVWEYSGNIFHISDYYFESLTHAVTCFLYATSCRISCILQISHMLWTGICGVDVSRPTLELRPRRHRILANRLHLRRWLGFEHGKTFLASIFRRYRGDLLHRGPVLRLGCHFSRDYFVRACNRAELAIALPHGAL